MRKSLLFLLKFAISGLISVTDAEVQIPPFRSFDINSYSYVINLPKPFGEVMVTVSSEDGENANSLLVKFNDQSYDLNQEIWDRLYIFERPSISINRWNNDTEELPEEFEIWFPFGDMQKVDLHCEHEANDDKCYIFERPALILTFDLEGLGKVERFYFGDRTRTTEYVRDK